jgi:small GTP-binding protein
MLIMPISVTATPTVVLLLGRERSGKSALLNNLMGLDFNEKYINTTDVESIVIKNTDAGKIILRDTPGANRFNSITISWMHNTKDFICVIDPTTDDVSIQWVTLRNFLIQMVNVKWPSINLNVVITKTDLMGQKKTKLESSVTKLKQLIADFNSDGIKSFNCTITLFSSNAKYKPADHPIIKILHIQQKARIAAAPADGYLIENLCAKYEKATESRWGFTDASRAETLKNMRNELGVKR